MPEQQDRNAVIKEWYDQYRQDVYRFALYMLGDSGEAHDVVQEVFLRAIRSWESYRHSASPKTWLLTISRNYIRDIVKKKSRERKAVKGLQDIIDLEAKVIPSQELFLRESLKALKQTYRDVFVLRHIEELSVHQTAQVLGWSDGKVTTTDHRAIRRLRQVLEMSEKGVNNL